MCEGPSITVVEAPAGCGKTHAGADWAREFAAGQADGRVLVLTHTHAAADAFRARLGDVAGVEVRTLDSLIHEVAGAYHLALGLPADVGLWACANDAYTEVCSRVAAYVKRFPMVPESLAARYPILLCDEHQDASIDQEEVVRAIGDAGADLWILGDPMQAIYPEDGGPTASDERWRALRENAEDVIDLSEPHRWRGGSEELGAWTVESRERLRLGEPLDLRDPPDGVTLIRADYFSPKHGTIVLQGGDVGAVWEQISEDELLVLNPHNRMVRGIRSYFNRRLVIWEGHTREKLDQLVVSLTECEGDAREVAAAMCRFLSAVSVGFNQSYADRILREIDEGCGKAARGVKPPVLQQAAREILATPSHIGIVEALRVLLKKEGSLEIRVDYTSEVWDLARLQQFMDPVAGSHELQSRRSRSPQRLPKKAVSTVHKAKGLEFSRVMIMPVDRKHFPDSPKGRRLLYVALSRAVRSLVLVVPNDDPSELLAL